MNDGDHGLPRAQLNRLFGVMLAMVAVMLLISAYAWFQLPGNARIPVHWGINGTPDRFAGKTPGLLIPPLVALGVAVVIRLIPVLEPRRGNLLRSMVAYRAVSVLVTGFLLALHAATVGNLLGIFHLNISVVVGMLLGVLFMVLGNYMGKVRSNFMFGIRTPWTLSSNVAWDRTHRLGGKLFFVTGLAGLLLSLLLGRAGFRIMLVMIIATAIFTVFYSWLIWRKAPDRRTQ